MATKNDRTHYFKFLSHVDCKYLVPIPTICFIRRFFFSYWSSHVFPWTAMVYGWYFVVVFVRFWIYSFFSWITIFLDYLHLSCVVTYLMVLCQTWFYPNVLGSSSAALLMCQSWNFDFRILRNICYGFFSTPQDQLKTKEKLILLVKVFFFNP